MAYHIHPNDFAMHALGKVQAEAAEREAKVAALPNAHRFVPGLDNAPACPECGESLHTVECPAGGAVWWHCDHCGFDSY